MRFSETHIGDMKRAIQVASAAVAALVVTTLLGMPQGYWSVVSAIVVIQTSVGSDVIGAAMERSIGTIAGALVGGAAASLRPDGLVSLALCLSLATAGLAFLAAGRPWLKMAPVTAAILLAASTHVDGSAVLALDRILEILIGGAIGITATLVLFPGHGHRAFSVASRETASSLAGLIDLVAQRMEADGSSSELLGLHDQVRAKLDGLARAASGLSRGTGDRSKADQRKALIRAFWRVRNDIVLVSRSLARPQPVGRAADNAAHLVRSLGEARETLLALAEGRRPVHLDPGSVTARLSLSDAQMVADVGQIESVLGLRHAFQNLNDLTDRFEDLSLGLKAPR